MSVIEGFDEIISYLQKQSARIEKLEDENEYLRVEVEDYEVHGSQLENDVEALLAENEKLKKEVGEWKEVALDYDLETPSELTDWMSASIHEDDEEYSKYIEPLELREENEKLKEQIESSTIREVRAARDKALAEVARLKEQIKNQ